MIQVFNINKGLCWALMDLNEFAVLKNISLKREIESQGKNHLIDFLLKKTIQIDYDNNGKPFLKGDSRHISISHSFGKLAIIVNEHQTTGIDIEIIRDKVLSVKHKFLSLSELEDAGEDIEKLLIYWSAKETLYKIYGVKQINFIKHLSVKPFTKSLSGNLVGSVQFSNTNIELFELNYHFIQNYVIVYCVKRLN